MWLTILDLASLATFRFVRHPAITDHQTLLMLSRFTSLLGRKVHLGADRINATREEISASERQEKGKEKNESKREMRSMAVRMYFAPFLCRVVFPSLLLHPRCILFLHLQRIITRADLLAYFCSCHHHNHLPSCRRRRRRHGNQPKQPNNKLKPTCFCSRALVGTSLEGRNRRQIGPMYHPAQAV